MTTDTADPGRPHRATILVEREARVLSQTSFEGEQRILRIAAPRIARAARPGSFVHLRCDPLMPMRRPLSIMRADLDDGWIELLYKIVGAGTEHLAAREPGETLDVLGPIGTPFEPVTNRSRALLIGGGVGIPPMVFMAERLASTHPEIAPLVLMGSEVPFPFEVRASQLAVPGMASEIGGSMPLLEAQGIASRLASGGDIAGCHRGYVTELARDWLLALGTDGRSEVAIYACGPTPMLAACAALATELELPCRVCLEEYMACAVGGCAGCAVRVRTSDGPAMKRVCIDGPVFDASTIVWQ